MPRLSKSSAGICFRVRDFIKKYLQVDLYDKKLLIAFSHGADSTALLIILNFLQTEFGFELSAMHINHGLRSESAAEARKAAEFCQKLGIPCLVADADVSALAKSRKIGLEDAGRRLRHEFLEKERLARQAHWIVTGHHLDDLGEDLLLRLVRGAGWPALAGMRAVDEHRHILRPLLLIEADELKRMLVEQDQPWVEDASNASDDFRRNRLRHGAMALLKKENPSLGKKMADLWRMARDDEEHWRKYLDKAMKTHPPLRRERSVTLSRHLLESLDRASRMRLYTVIIYEMNAGQPLAEAIFQMDQALADGRGRTMFQFPGGLAATVLRGEIIFMIK